MDQRLVWKRVCLVLGKYSGADPDEIGPGRSLGVEAKPNYYDLEAKCAPLNLDSLDLVEVKLALEDEFGIDITDDELDGEPLNHVGGLVAFIQGKADAKLPRYEPVPEEVAIARIRAGIPVHGGNGDHVQKVEDTGKRWSQTLFIAGFRAALHRQPNGAIYDPREAQAAYFQFQASNPDIFGGRVG